MIVLSHNYRGLANPTKILAIKRLVKIHSPSIMLLQETMIVGKKVESSLSASFPGWDFLALDTREDLWNHHMLEEIHTQIQPPLAGIKILSGGYHELLDSLQPSFFRIHMHSIHVKP
jgi:hypothetical protein